MSRTISAVMAVVLATATNSALAQIAPRATQQQLATCLYERHAKPAAELLDSSDSETTVRAYNALFAETVCVDRVFGGTYTADQASVPPGVLRGMIAEAALVQRAAAVAALQPLPLQQRRYVRPWLGATGRTQALDEMAVCVADTDPAAINSLLTMGAGSNAEGAALGAMGTDFHRCLGAGTELHSGPEWIRAALADALYQRLTHPAFSTPTYEAPSSPVPRKPERGR